LIGLLPIQLKDKTTTFLSPQAGMHQFLKIFCVGLEANAATVSRPTKGGK
jgi:hypothetical protein